MSAVTQWFEPDEKPVHIGVYQRDLLGWKIKYSFWDGVIFGFAASSPENAIIAKSVPSANQYLPWRGLAEKPNE